MAPEQCFLTLFKKMNNLDYTTADLYSPIVDVKADILELPFGENEFDIVFCNHVLEHIVDDQKAMKELFRVMKPGGMGVFQVPQDLTRENSFEDAQIKTPEDRAKYYGQYDHVRVYGRDYFDRLRNAGFKVKEINLTQTMKSDLVDRYRLMEGEILPLCFKPVES
jgi:predicted SAM-dependent methyltransferase